MDGTGSGVVIVSPHTFDLLCLFSPTHAGAPPTYVSPNRNFLRCYLFILSKQLMFKKFSNMGSHNLLKILMQKFCLNRVVLADCNQYNMESYADRQLKLTVSCIVEFVLSSS